MNWITQKKRLAIYLRDGLSCAYCGDSVEDGAKLSLDHLTPHSLGGSNRESNLITCCTKCNSSRGNRELDEFVTTVAAYINHGVTAEMIMTHISERTAEKLRPYLVEATALIERRGSVAKVLQNL